MKKPISHAAQAIDRRAALGSLAAGAMLLVSRPAKPAEADLELIDLDLAIRRLIADIDRIEAERVAPFHQDFENLIFAWSPDAATKSERWQKAKKFAAECGMSDAQNEVERLWKLVDSLFERVCATSAVSACGKAAKIRVFLATRTFPGNWSEADEWCVERSLALLAELAGVELESLNIAPPAPKTEA